MKKEKNRSVIYVAIFIALIMALSIIGFLWSGGSKGQYSYNGFSFNSEAGEWKTSLGQKTLAFQNLPEEVSNISISDEAKYLIQNAKMIYISYNPGEDGEELALTQYSLSLNIGTNSRFAVNAVTESNETNLPAITCANATQPVPVILLEKNETSGSIILNNSCLILKGQPQKLADRLVYAIYGIIK